jgi:cAMP-specific phosphodiesterase 4
MEEDDDEVRSSTGGRISKQQVSSFQQSTRLQQSSSVLSSGNVSAQTSSNTSNENAVQEQQLSESLHSSTFRQFTSSSHTKSTRNKTQGRLTHMLAYETGSEDSLNITSNPNAQGLLGVVIEKAEELSSSVMMQASDSSLVTSAQEKQNYGSISSQLSSSSGESSLIYSAESTATMPVLQKKGLSAQNQNQMASKCSMTYLSASQLDYENIQQKRHMSRSLSPTPNASSEVHGTGLSPSRTLSVAKSVETSDRGREGRQWLTAMGSGTCRSETAKSMESLPSSSTTSVSGGTTVHHSYRQSFLTSFERDMRRAVARSVEARSLENLEKEMRLMGKRKAISGEELKAGVEESGMTEAERRRGLYAGVVNLGERKTTVPQHLSLPPPSGAYLSLATPGGDRKLTILSPHSPHQADLLQLSSSLTTLKTRRKKAIVLPRLILPRSESDVFLE